MQCPHCHSDKLKVTDSRETEETIRRRRECRDCKKRFTTYERIERAPLIVIKKDGRRQLFDRNKLVKGIEIACGKRPISRDKIEKIVDDVETELKNMDKTEVKSKLIGEMVMEKLKVLDFVAYLRFASVFKADQFKDIKDIERELRALKK